MGEKGEGSGGKGEGTGNGVPHCPPPQMLVYQKSMFDRDDFIT